MSARSYALDSVSPNLLFFLLVLLFSFRYGTAVPRDYFKDQSMPVLNPPVHTVWLNDLRCLGDEGTVESCLHSTLGKHNCAPHEQAGVVCTNSSRQVTPKRKRKYSHYSNQ